MWVSIQERSLNVIVLKAMGQATSKAVAVSEIIKVEVLLFCHFVDSFINLAFLDLYV